MKKVLIVNEGSSNNLGDQLINITISKIFDKHKSKNITFAWSSYSFAGSVSEEVVSSVNNNFIKRIKSYLGQTIYYRSIARQKWLKKNKQKLQDIKNKNYDVLIIGGGQLLNNSWLYPFLFSIWVSLFEGKSIYIFGVGIGDKFNFLDKKIVKKALRKCTRISVRDFHSKKFIEDSVELYCDYLPDPVFKISDFYKFTDKKNQAIILPVSYENVYLRYNNKMSEQEYIDAWLKKIEDYSEKSERVIISITDLMQDRRMFNILKERISDKSNVVFELPKNVEHLLELIATSQFVYSGRMHALIIGFSYNCTCEVFEISNKLKTFNKEIVNNKNITIKDLKKRIDEYSNSFIYEN